MVMWASAIASVLFSYLLSLKTKNQKKFFLIFSGIFITLILGSRYFINGFTDEITYNEEYSGYSEMSISQLFRAQWGERDFGFTFIYWLMAQVFPWRQFPIYFITAFFIFASFRFIYKNSEVPFVSILLVFAFDIFSFYMAGYRQCFAMCFCLFAYEFAKKRKFLPYILLMAVAVSMHLSAIIFLPTYWLFNLKNNASSKIVWIILLIILWLAESWLIQIGSEIGGRDYTQEKEFSLVGYFIQIIIMITPFLLHLYVSQKMPFREKQRDFTVLVLLSIGLVFYASKIFIFAYERISYYYSFFIVAALPNGIVKFGSDKNDNALISLLIGMLLLILAFWRMPEGLTLFFTV